MMIMRVLLVATALSTALAQGPCGCENSTNFCNYANLTGNDARECIPCSEARIHEPYATNASECYNPSNRLPAAGAADCHLRCFGGNTSTAANTTEVVTNNTTGGGNTSTAASTTEVVTNNTTGGGNTTEAITTTAAATTTEAVTTTADVDTSEGVTTTEAVTTTAAATTTEAVTTTADVITTEGKRAVTKRVDTVDATTVRVRLPLIDYDKCCKNEAGKADFLEQCTAKQETGLECISVERGSVVITFQGSAAAVKLLKTTGPNDFGVYKVAGYGIDSTTTNGADSAFRMLLAFAGAAIAASLIVV